jgi:plasmid stabilization system protein ParE
MYRIEIAASAQADADAAYAWMAENISPAFAEKWYRELFKQIDTLTKHPQRYPVARESHKFPEEIRELIYGKRKHKNKYRILFAIRQDAVAILYIHHSARADIEP